MNSPLDFQIVAMLAIVSHTLDSVTMFTGRSYPTDLPVANVTWRNKEAMDSGRVVAMKGSAIRMVIHKQAS